MALTKNKKRFLLVFLGAYVVFSIAFAVFVAQDRKLADSPDMKSVASARRDAIHDKLAAAETDSKETIKLTDKQVDRIYQVIYGAAPADASQQDKVAAARKDALRKAFEDSKGFVTNDAAARISTVLFGPANSDADKEKRIAEIKQFAAEHAVMPDDRQLEESYAIIYGPKLDPIALNFTMIMQILNFGALATILYILLWEPLTKFLDARKKKIQDEMDAAAAAKAEAEKLDQEYRRKMHDAREEAAKLVEDGRRRAEDREKEILDEARVAAERIKERSRAELAAAEAAVKKSLRGEFAAVSVSIAEKILERSITDKDHAALVEDALDGLKKEGLKFD